MNKRIISNRVDINDSFRAILKPGLYSVLPPASRRKSVIPGFEKVEVQVLVAPNFGANFIQYELFFKKDENIKIQQNDSFEHFLFVFEGEIEIKTNLEIKTLGEGGFAYLPPNTEYNIEKSNNRKGRALITKKIYKPLNSLNQPSSIFSNIKDISMIDSGASFGQHLIPFDDDLTYDMAMNVLYFEPGVSIRSVECHIMEHGLYMLEGRGIYWLNGDYHEVQKNDYIYMAPYCPQFFYSTGGGVKASYLLYKEVNRDYIEN